ncbi:uncharacterized protein LOC126762803 [Bactrocera neohumeralis]|uniref:uncharacterized protein LOC126762803 n=1 Tax=Bactrocera neohumeralis TaxID=98809 RepID=UPI002164FC92|nr:uncharacterized protein LOC126762803 [Bactrocera neohumeralis]
MLMKPREQATHKDNKKMKLFAVALAACFIACAIAQSAPAEPSAEYLPPVGDESAPLADDGYRYKAVRRLKYRHRRELPSEEYLPPVAEPSSEYIPPEGAETRVAEDGYRYKTVRRFKVHRHRREAPSVEYLPPVVEPSAEYLPPEGAETRVADDGYRYKTVRRLRFRARHRRDVSELPSAEYLPPVEVELAPELKTVLGDEGYRYKTVRRLKYRRHRREAEAAEEVAAAESVDAPNGEYLPPSNDVAEVPEVKSAELAQDGYRYKTKLFVVTFAVGLASLAFAQSLPIDSVEPSAEYLSPVGEESTPLADDGYRYKAVRRLKYRHRREVPSEEYLPPVAEPSSEYIPPEGAETRVAEDGYRYKTVRRFKVHRHRREAPSVEYLPPVVEPSAEYLPPEGAETRVADDGYLYKTVRRLRYRARHRRDVSELTSLPSAEYLPPVEVELAPELKTILGDDGYRYKAVRRLKYRRHRREAEAAEEVAAAESVDAPNGEYLPPSNDIAEVPEVKSTELAQDGYRYKTVRRLKYRRNRREVEAAEDIAAAKSFDAPNGEYLPPSNDIAEVPAAKSAELAQDGYRYKTVRRIRYRYRH